MVSFFLSASFNICFLWLTFFFVLCLTALTLPAAFYCFSELRTTVKGIVMSAKSETDPVRKI